VVAPLALPDLHQDAAAEALAKSPAVTLFVQRAKAVNSGLPLDAARLRTIAELCIRLDEPYAFQFNWLSAEMLEQSDAITEQDRRQVDMYFVEQPGLEALLRDTRGGDGHILVACGLLCLTNGAFHAVGHEGERRTLLDPFLWDGVGDNKTRGMGRIAAPGFGDIEHSPSCQHGIAWHPLPGPPLYLAGTLHARWRVALFLFSHAGNMLTQRLF